MKNYSNDIQYHTCSFIGEWGDLRCRICDSRPKRNSKDGRLERLMQAMKKIELKWEKEKRKW